jgi:hypothetical protein
MSSLWVYIVCYLAGWVSCLLLIYYTDKPDIVQHVNKIKQKGGPGNTMDTQVEFINGTGKSKKELRMEKRELRQQKRKDKNNK